ncbi:MAG: 16S rRNA (guanine(527)-N(7))-methyltransferase RsmG [Betaproteobacteria bacterium]|nr:16S rRNA (guanine(527)-N(7))-methyltransferase RsmG [Betaproteobacteria bacterium]
MPVAADGPASGSDELLALQEPFFRQLAALGLPLPQPLTTVQGESLFRFLRLLRRWNATHNLTAITSAQELVHTHLLDPLLALPLLSRRAAEARFGTILDVGSGAGIPAIPWALVDPTLCLALVEKSGKKAAFLRHAVARLGLFTRVSVIQADVERLQRNPSYAIITSRAFAALPKFLSVTMHLSAPGTRWVYMAGRLEAIEGLDINKSMYTHPISMPRILGEVVLDAVDPLNHPSGMQRHLVWLRRIA